MMFYRLEEDVYGLKEQKEPCLNQVMALKMTERELDIKEQSMTKFHSFKNIKGKEKKKLV